MNNCINKSKWFKNMRFQFDLGNLWFAFEQCFEVCITWMINPLVPDFLRIGHAIYHFKVIFVIFLEPNILFKSKHRILLKEKWSHSELSNEAFFGCPNCISFVHIP